MSDGNRYLNRTPFLNKNSLYDDLMRKRHVRQIVHWQSPRFTYPKSSEINELDIVQTVWTQGTRFFKLAAEYYGDTRLWWIIPWFNQKPLESDFRKGDIVDIPLPLNDVLMLFEED